MQLTNIALITILALGTGIAVAQSSASNNPQRLPINLTADNGEYDAEAGKATYTGHVVITHGKMNLSADKVIISIDNGQVTLIEAWGNRASFHYVPVGQPPIDGKAQYLKYTIATATVDMDKQAWVQQEKNQTTGSHLSYNLEKQKIKGSSVNMTLIPKTQ